MSNNPIIDYASTSYVSQPLKRVAKTNFPVRFSPCPTFIYAKKETNKKIEQEKSIIDCLQYLQLSAFFLLTMQRYHYTYYFATYFCKLP